MEFQDRNILIALQRGTLGGAERQAMGLAEFLTEKKECHVDLLITSSNKMTQEFKMALLESGIREVYFFGDPYLTLKREWSIKNLKRLKWSVQYLLKLRNGLKDNKYDVLIPFLNFPSKLCFYLYKILPDAKYTFWHQLGLDTWKFDFTEYLAVKNVPCIIGNAENCFDVFVNKYRLKREKMHLLPQYITLKRIKLNSDSLKIKFGIPPNKLVFGMIAHFADFKYHDLAYNVFKKLNEKHPDTHLVLMGNSENDENAQNIYFQLKESIEKDKFELKVTLLSNQNVIEVLNLLDVGMLLSLTEGTPNVVMEYMLYGLPVIASNHPGCNALLKDSKLLINNNCEKEIYDAMEKLITCDALRNEEGNNNSENIKAYNVEDYVLNLEKILT